MNLNCYHCGKVFGEWDWVKCDGCERLSHRVPCGAYELIEREGAHYAYFFCNSCQEEEYFD